MFYAKNLPVWERALRASIGLGLGIYGLTGFAASPLGYAVAASGAVAALTGFLGFCPMCALVGRKLKTAE